MFIALEVRLSELEARFHKLDHSHVGVVASQANVGDWPRVAAANSSPAAPVQPASQGGWVMVRRKRSPKQRSVDHHH